MKKNVTAHVKIGIELNSIDSPSNTASTPRIIGFLTCRYKPVTTKFFGGDHGASVPFPIRINEAMQIAMTINPPTITKDPATS